jgi:signal transduction histidine kinase
VLAPSGRDAALTCTLLERAGVLACACRDMEELCQRVRGEGAAGVMVAEEALTAPALRLLRGLLAEQPAWSDLPILLFTPGAGESRHPRLKQLIEELGNLTLLDRPLRPVTMLSAARAALRARGRQYIARGELQLQQRAVEQRDQFLAMLGHELRNPLAAISMAVELNGMELEHYRGIVRRQARHLTRLVDDLLDVSRVTSARSCCSARCWT